MFDPIPQRASANVRAEQQLRDSILAGRLAPGAKLPTERELSAQFGISRLTLRAALATLAAQGLLQVRQGSGYIVRDIRESGGSDLLPAIAARIGAMAGPELADLLRMRRYVAAALLEALVERPPSKAARAAVADAIETFAVIPPKDIEALAHADLAIVRALLAAANSLVLQVCLNPIVAVVQNNATLRVAMYREPASNLAAWRGVHAWLARPVATAIPTLLALLAQHDARTLTAVVRRRKATV